MFHMEKRSRNMLIIIIIIIAFFSMCMLLLCKPFWQSSCDALYLEFFQCFGPCVVVKERHGSTKIDTLKAMELNKYSQQSALHYNDKGSESHTLTTQ